MNRHIKKANKDRMIKTFTELVQIPSLSYKEGKFAKHLIKKLKSLGCKVYVDNAGKKIGGETGNIIARFGGTVKSRPLLLCSHMDTVSPGENIKPIIKKDRICTDGSTIMAADCKAGITIILEILHILKERKQKHLPVEAVFTVAEEPGILGSRNLDCSKIKSKYGIVLDNLYSDTIINRESGKISLDIKIKGKAAHSGLAPEKGISAIEVLSKAVAMCKWGRIDKYSSANIGLVKGGKAKNVVMPEIEVTAEVRSHNAVKLKRHAANIKKTFKKACNQSSKKIDGKMVYPKLEFKTTIDYLNMEVKPKEPVIRQLVKSAKTCGIKMKLIAGGGASDANFLTRRGIISPKMGCGERNIHSTDEYLDLKDFFQAAEIVLDTVLNFRC
jgi:tripeptide aminopeptidase